MQFITTKFEDAWLIEPELIKDDRGFFARTWCQQEFDAHGLVSRFVQASLSFNEHAGTLRGLHWQAEPYEEVKLVSCNSGAIFDVIADIRPESPTFGQWQGFELTSSNRHTLYIPAGFAHGFLTLEPASEVSYRMSEFYVAEHSSGVHWADLTLNVTWPNPVRVIADRDTNLPTLKQLMLSVPKRSVYSDA